GPGRDPALGLTGGQEEIEEAAGHMDGSNDSEEIRTPLVPTALEVEDEAMDIKVSTQPETLDVGHVNTNTEEEKEGYPQTQPAVDSGSPVEKAATVEVVGMDGDLWMEDRRTPPADIKDEDSDSSSSSSSSPSSPRVRLLGEDEEEDDEGFSQPAPVKTRDEVLLESLKDTPPLTEDSIIFTLDRLAVGKVFEVFGPVSSPYYVLRFNSVDEISVKGLVVGSTVFFTPDHKEYTGYVFTKRLQNFKGSDASWKNDQEPPPEALDYSDDEEEQEAKKKKRQNTKKKKENVNCSQGHPAATWAQNQLPPPHHHHHYRLFPARPHGAAPPRYSHQGPMHHPPTPFQHPPPSHHSYPPPLCPYPPLPGPPYPPHNFPLYPPPPPPHHSSSSYGPLQLPPPLPWHLGLHLPAPPPPPPPPPPSH
ncbi:hypothetical protein CRUP_002749, partial [Coryphaenoides rupestris]